MVENQICPVMHATLSAQPET